MSLHGYNVTHGFFSGTCIGSKELPFEQSCDLVKGFIKSAKDQLASVERNVAKLREPATSTTCWVNPYIPANWNGWKGGHVWIQAELRTKDNGMTKAAGYSNDYVSIVFNNSHPHAKGAEAVLERTVAIDKLDLLAVATKQNADRASFLERTEVASLRRYIKWQTERVASWKPQPLFPVAHKDKEGFNPEAA
jgi:hypothetical protein